MLAEYIERYKEALRKKDKKEQERIEKELQKLGMDRATLRFLIREGA